MILQTLLFVLLRYKMSVWELLNVSVSAMLVDTRQKKYRSSFYS